MRTANPDPSDSPAWHALDGSEVLTRLESRPDGLSGTEAAARLAGHGRNRLPALKRRGPLLRFLLQFHNLLIYVLLAASGVTAALGHWIDCTVILGVVLINALIGFIQEGKAEKALESIRGLLSLHAFVMRDGRRQEIAAEELVPGDLVMLQAGDKVPADLRLLQCRELRIDEALLTGESQPVGKAPGAVAAAAAIGDRFGMAYSGTAVTYGRGTGVVVATGRHTEIGRISQLLAEVQSLTTPLLARMAIFARWLTAVIMVLAGGTFAFGVLVHAYPWSEMFLAAVGLIVAAIPEGLPAIITITLAIGVQRMARRNAIIRRLPAVETLGAVTVICSDKTGTLTRNEMMVRSVVTAAGRYAVDGRGYDPHGAVLSEGAETAGEAPPLLQELALAALLCNDALLEQHDGQWLVRGDPTEGALLVLAGKLGLDARHESRLRPRADAIPFESERRFMATLHHDHTGHGYIYLKGAPERVLEMCDRQRGPEGDEPLERGLWHRAAEELAGRGQRLLALAVKPAGEARRELAFADVEEGLTLLGLLGIADPPRPEAIEAVAACRAAGIRVMMITGDHALTARAIGAEMGIGAGGEVVSGPELEGADHQMLQAWVRRVEIFARSSPEHKLRLVEALQAGGEVTAMTGDGVNDAPALKRSDVGVAMGIKGTEVAKEAAEMVLADDNFAAIAHAVEEGRTVYDNIRKAIAFILPTNVAEALILVVAIILGQTLPITPVQILWINMITAVTLALTLAFEPPENDVMHRPPRDPREPLIGAVLLWRLSYVCAILVTGTFALFLWVRDQGMEVAFARTAAVNALVVFEAFYLLNSRYLHASVLNVRGLTGNRYALWAIGLVLVLQLLFTYSAPLQALFGTVAIDAATWGVIVLVGATIFFLVELEKLLYCRWQGRRRK